MERILEYTATEDGTVQNLLKSKGFSERICNLLKKELGLVCVNGEPVFVVAKVNAGDNMDVSNPHTITLCI